MQDASHAHTGRLNASSCDDAAFWTAHVVTEMNELPEGASTAALYIF